MQLYFPRLISLICLFVSLKINILNTWSPTTNPYSQGTKNNHGLSSILRDELNELIYFYFSFSFSFSFFLHLYLFVGILAQLELKVTIFGQFLLSMHLSENPIFNLRNIWLIINSAHFGLFVEKEL